MPRFHSSSELSCWPLDSPAESEDEARNDWPPQSRPSAASPTAALLIPGGHHSAVHPGWPSLRRSVGSVRFCLRCFRFCFPLFSFQIVCHVSKVPGSSQVFRRESDARNGCGTSFCPCFDGESPIPTTPGRSSPRTSRYHSCCTSTAGIQWSPWILFDTHTSRPNILLQKDVLSNVDLHSWAAGVKNRHSHVDCGFAVWRYYVWTMEDLGPPWLC